jgi:hypothetical protein
MSEIQKLIAKRIVELNEQSEKSVEELFEDLEGESISPSEVVEADMKRKGVVTDVDPVKKGTPPRLLEE